MENTFVKKKEVCFS